MAPNSPSLRFCHVFEIFENSKMIDEKWCKSNRKTEKSPRENAIKRTKRMVRITTSSTKMTNEPWRRVRRMRSKFGNIFLNVILIKPRHIIMLLKEADEMK